MQSVRAAVSCCLLFTLLLPGHLAARLEDAADPRRESAALDVLEREREIYALRERARVAAGATPQDSGILGHLSRINDEFGDHAAEAYERWANALARSGAPEPEITQALERGVVVALRDGDQERARRLSSRLGPASRYSQLSVTEPTLRSESSLDISGGTRALARVVEIDPSLSDSRFMTEYARAILRRSNLGIESKRIFEARLKRYFETIRVLVSYGRPVGGELEVALDLTSPAELDRSGKILSALGWQVLRLGNDVLLEVAAGTENGERQQFATALGIDEADMKLSLEARKPFLLRLRNSRVPLLLDLPYWVKLTVKKAVPNQGLLEDMIYNPSVAGLYVALSDMNDDTRRAILSVIPTEDLLNRIRQLSFYGASVTIEKGRLILPGGTEATEAWRALAGVDPSQIDGFIRNLTKKDEGKLFAYYHSLAGLPSPNQRFFTRTPSRLARFYKVFPFSDEKIVRSGLFSRKENPFARLAREIPLDAEGNVQFPGSDRVWMVATGGRKNISDVGKLVQRAGHVRTPDAEDEILLDMLEREYVDERYRKFRRIENFLAVVRIDAHRRQPMDETMALALAQNFAKYKNVYPYFAELTELTGQQTISFFQAAKRLEALGNAELNFAMGEFQALLKLISLLHESRAISDGKAAELFASVCTGFAGINQSRDLAIVSFDSAERILNAIDGVAATDADERLGRAFVGQGTKTEFKLQGSTFSFDFADANERRMREVLRLQAIVPLDAILQAYHGALKLTQGMDSQSVEQIERSLPKIVEIGPERDKGGFVPGRPSELAGLLQRLKRQLEVTNPSAQGISKTANDLIQELNPFLRTTLVGWIYGYYFSPADLAVASNRYFIRAHVFSDRISKGYWPQSSFEQSPGGSRLRGGFAQFGMALGSIASTAVNPSESVGQDHMAALQLAAVRSVPWNVVSTRSIHLAALRIRLGREFVVQAAFNDPLRELLASTTVGTLGPTRRRELVASVASHDVSHALSLLTASDLLFLAEAFIQTPLDRGNSAALLAASGAELRQVPLQQINYFGGIHAETGGCTHPHLINSVPYEDYADQVLATPLAERMSDILLQVVESADRSTLPVEAVGMLAESVVRRFYEETRSTPREDWLTAAQVMSRIDLSDFVSVLEKR